MKIPTSLSSSLGKQGLLLQKNSPHILFGVGIAGVVGTAVLASKATLSLEELLRDAAETKQMMQDAHDQDPERFPADKLADGQRRLYVQNVVKVGKLYAPAVGVGIFSVACLTSSHNILTKRNAAVTAAYAALDKGFGEYRDRVVDRYGEDVDREMRYGVEEVKVKNPDTNKMETKRRVKSDEDPSIYARFFNESSHKWQPDAEMNLACIRMVQNHANDVLKLRGYIFLNEVYEALGLTPTTAGSIVGWRLFGENSDNLVDFGLYGTEFRDAPMDFVNGKENEVLLDFNVDGIIYDQIDAIVKKKAGR